MKVVVVGGGICSGKSGIIAKLAEALPGYNFVEGGAAHGICEELSRMAGSDLEELAIRASRVDALRRELAQAPPAVYVHLIIGPAVQSYRVRRRAQEGDEKWRLWEIQNQHRYQRAVFPQLCKGVDTIYFPVMMDRGVSIDDFLPELARALA